MAHRKPALCPHCDSTNVRRMDDRPHESESSVIWFECADCRRLWSVPKTVEPTAPPATASAKSKPPQHR